MTHLYWIQPLKMVIFHSYVSLPEGSPTFIAVDSCIYIYISYIQISFRKIRSLSVQWHEKYLDLYIYIYIIGIYMYDKIFITPQKKTINIQEVLSEAPIKLH